MSLVFLRRKSRILLLIGIAGSLFLCFQLFSFKVISISSRNEDENQRQARVLDDGLELEFEQEKHNIDSKQNLDKSSDLKFDGKDLKPNKHVIDSKPEMVKSNDLKPQEKDLKEDMKKSQDKILPVVKEIADKSEKTEKYQHVRGTHLDQAEDYREKNGMFQCIQSKELIPFSQVNDDYCDCADATDEPGTAACPNSMFYCTFQNSQQSQQKILGSMVNDGVCDCCDGSDEWAGIQVYGGVHIKGKVYKNSLTHSPCNNTCKAVQQNLEEDAKIRELGKRLKQTYLESGQKVKDTDAYGPEGVFYQLSLTCFDHETKEYKYTFCPFKSVTQQSFPKAAIFIGKKPVWRTRLKGVYVLKMEGGDMSACPGGKQRQTVITFICGLSDHIIEISEDEKCVYGMKFSTPAAC